MKIALALLLSFASPLAFAATIGIQGLIEFLVYIVVVGLIFWLLWWLLQQIGLPEPFAKVARIVLAVVAVVICINILLGLVGTPFITFR